MTLGCLLAVHICYVEDIHQLRSGLCTVSPKGGAHGEMQHP